MRGITLTELYDFLLHGHEVEYQYKGKTYTLVPWGNVSGHEEYFLFGDNCGKEGLAHVIAKEEETPIQTIERFLHTRCMDGESFLSAEKDIVVEIVF